MMEDIEWQKPDKKKTANLQLIRAAFLAGFKSGVAFCHESVSTNHHYWRRKDWKEFVAKRKIKD